MNGNDRGSLSIVLGVLVLVTLAGAALVVDGGRAMAARRQAANTAEAAARVAMARSSLTSGFDPARAVDLAVDHAVRSGVAPDDVEVQVRTGPAGAPEVVVTITARRTTVFLALGGAEELTVRARGAATSVYDP
jgi:Flp pilus assembly protein TadG